MATQDRAATGNGAENNWTSSTGGNKWDDVATADDATSYILDTSPASSQGFTFTAFAFTSSAVNFVRVSFRSLVSTGAATVQGRLRVSAANYLIGSAQNQTTSWADYTCDALTNPATGSAWTEGEVEGSALTNFGMSSGGLAGAEENRVTYILCTVDYTDAGGRTALNTRSHPLGVEVGMGWRMPH